MQKARELRLKLKNVRISVDKTRKQLKEQALREGRAIDGMANIIKALVVPAEQYLEKQEKFAELKKAERLEKRHSERLEKLLKYVEDVNIYQLRSMTDEAFETLLNISKRAYQDQIEAEKKVEADRVAKEKADLKEQERIRKENEVLKKEAEEKTKQEKIDQDKRNKIEVQRVAKEKEERKKYDLIDEKRKAQQEVKLNAERKKREQAETKLKAETDAIKKDQEAKRAKIQAEKKAQDEVRRKALLAPDKEKLLKLANTIELIQYPSLESKQAKDICDSTMNKLINAVDYLRGEAKKL